MEAVEAIALVKGHVEHELLLRNEYLAAENEILRSRLEGLEVPASGPIQCRERLGGLLKHYYRAA